MKENEPWVNLELVTKSPRTYDMLISFIIDMPKFLVAEFNTHRMMCLSGDSQLEFELPSGSTQGYPRVHRMTLQKFASKWFEGANRITANPKKYVDCSKICENFDYSIPELSELTGLSKSYLRNYSKKGLIKSFIHNDVVRILGKDFLNWRKSVPEHTRFSIRDRLRAMRIRQLNETTGELQTSTIKDVFINGEKKLFKLTAGDFSVKASKDHRILTESGWKTLENITTEDYVVVRKFGKTESDKVDPQRLTKIGGKFRSVWQRQMRQKYLTDDPLCRDCKSEVATDVHHIIPVATDPNKTYDESNITFLCTKCHTKQHAKQYHQGGNYLYGAGVKVDSIVYYGSEITYDLEIEGDFPNFLANGIVVHNSRNSASTRAIPLKTQLERIGGEDMFVPPVIFENCKGMAGKTLMSPEDYDEVEKLIINQYHKCTEPFIQELMALNVHKQHAGRYLEPWMWTRVLATANIEWWEDFVRQRYSPAAQPEIERIASEINQALLRLKEKNEYHYSFWHIPLLTDEERETVSRLPQWVSPDFTLEWNQLDTREDILWWCAVASARCARISYLNEKGERSYDDDLDLFSRLLKESHNSPFEHVARVINPKKDKGIYFREGYGLMDNNFTGFYQYRSVLKYSS